MTKVFYTYLHLDAQGRVFYVGCATIDPNKRGTRAKTQRAYSKSGHSEAWDRIAADGYSVVILQMHNDRDVAFAQEREYITAFRLAGAQIVNVCDGGAGAPGSKNSDEVKRKKSVTKIGTLNPMYGKTGASHHGSRPVVDRLTGVRYPSMTAAATSIGMKVGTLYNMLVGTNPNRTNLEFA